MEVVDKAGRRWHTGIYADPLLAARAANEALSVCGGGARPNWDLCGGQSYKIGCFLHFLLSITSG